MSPKRLYLVSISLAATIILQLLSSCAAGISDTNPDTAFARYVKAYTGVGISASSTIKIEFSTTVRHQCTERGLLSFSPSLKGDLRWEDGRTLTFIPLEGQLRSGREYTATLELDKLFDIEDKAMKKFRFGFTVTPLQADIIPEGITVTEDDPSMVTASGRILFNEPVTVSLARETFAYEYPHEGTSVEISGEDTASEFCYTIRGIAKGDSPRKLTVRIDGRRHGVGSSAKYVSEIPAREPLTVADARCTVSGDNVVEIWFSNPIPAKTDLRGLVEVEGGGRHHYQIRDNLVRVFFEHSGSDSVSVSVSEFLKDTRGKALGERFIRTFSLSGPKPQVRIPLKGNILPDQANLKLPFEAAGLRAVDLSVVRIYEDNILSFLQENPLSGSSALRRSGRLVYRTTLHLDADASVNLHKWNTFCVDLKGLFDTEPGALYRIYLRFGKDYSVWGQPSQSQTQGHSQMIQVQTSGITSEDEAVWDTPQPYYYYDNGFDWSEYNWEDRDNPLKATYYSNSSIYAECNLIASDLGLIVKYADNGQAVATVCDIMTATPVKGAQVILYNYQLRPVGSGTTDGKGMAHISCSGKPFIATACMGGAKTYLRMTDGQENPTSRFDTGGLAAPSGFKAFIYGERGVWRPGDTLHLTMMLRDTDNKLPEGHPVTMEVFTPQGQLYDRAVCDKGVNGVYGFRFATPEHAPTGTWNAYFKVAGVTFHKALHIESIKPNRLKINIDVPKIIIKGQHNILNIAASWLSGPAAGRMAFRVNASLGKTSEAFDKFRDYTFNDPLSQFRSQQMEIASGKLDASGKATVPIETSDIAGAPGMLGARFTCTVMEPGGNESIASITVPVSVYSAYAGIRLPQQTIETDTPHTFDVAVIDESGNRVNGHTIEYSIYKLNWKWWWESSEQTLDSYVNGNQAEKIDEGTFKSSSGNTIPFRIDYPQWGKYLIYVKDLDSGHATGGVVSVDWPQWRGRSDKTDPDNASMITFSTDKDTYKVSEEATVYIPAAKDGKALVSFENASGVIFSDIVSTDADSETPYRFRITENMAPNFYIHITLLQPYGNRDNDLPLRMYGVRPVYVDNPGSRLDITITAPHVIRPLEEFSVSLSERQGQTMTYTLAIVDEGLLDITGFSTPDVWSAMFAKEALGVRTWDMYDQVIGAYAGKLSRMYSIGGDEFIADRGKRDNRFNPVVKFLGPFTAKDGKATHRITLPMYVGSVRIMAVAAGNGSYGSAHRSVPVRSPLMVVPTLPRTLGVNEDVTLAVNVFAMEDSVKDVDVSVHVEGPVGICGAQSKNIPFGETKDKLVRFALKSGTTEGTAKVTVTAKGGGYQARESISIRVSNSTPVVSNAQHHIVQPGESYTFAFDAKDAQEAFTELSGFPSVDFAGCLNWAQQYPYNCTEQIASRIMTLLNISGFVGKEAQEAIRTEVEQLLGQLCTRALADGGFPYWPGESTANEWVTSMAGEALVTAREAGYKVNSGTMSGWTAFQKRAVRNYRTGITRFSDINQAYRLYTMALASKPDIGAMNRMREAAMTDGTVLCLLASSYAIAGRENIAATLLEGISSIQDYEDSYNPVFGSALRDKALMIRAMLDAGMLDRAMREATAMAEQFNAEGCFMTQHSAFCTSAIKQLAAKTGSGVLKAEIIQDSTTPVNSVDGFYTKEIDPSSGKVTVRNLSQGAIYAGIVTKGRPSGKVDAQASSISLDIRYEDLAGTAVDASELRQGDNIRAVLTVRNLSASKDAKALALTYRVPSGWEIFNTRLYGDEASSDNASHDYLDIRDDRCVYCFDLGKGQSKTFTVRLNILYEGRYFLPPATCQAMYDASVFACSESSQTTIR